MAGSPLQNDPVTAKLPDPAVTVPGTWGPPSVEPKTRSLLVSSIQVGKKFVLALTGVDAPKPVWPAVGTMILLTGAGGLLTTSEEPVLYDGAAAPLVAFRPANT